MAIKIDRLEVKQQQRGRAELLATFDVNLGAFTIRGWDLVRYQGDTFVSGPSRSYKTDDGWKKYNFLAYNGAKGDKLQETIHELALEEFNRRATAPVSGGGDDDFPF